MCGSEGARGRAALYGTVRLCTPWVELSVRDQAARTGLACLLRIRANPLGPTHPAAVGGSRLQPQVSSLPPHVPQALTSETKALLQEGKQENKKTIGSAGRGGARGRNYTCPSPKLSRLEESEGAPLSSPPPSPLPPPSPSRRSRVPAFLGEPSSAGSAASSEQAKSPLPGIESVKEGDEEEEEHDGVEADGDEGDEDDSSDDSDDDDEDDDEERPDRDVGTAMAGMGLDSSDDSEGADGDGNEKTVCPA